LWFNLKRVLTERLDIIILLIFFLTVFLTRIPFTSKFLYQLDSVNYALAFQHFNINLSQPQAPGYIFFVALGKFINIFFNNPNTSMIFISIVFSILTVFLVYLLVKQMFSREIAVVASILLIFNPIFWFYGEIAMIYMSEALFATLIAYTSYKLLKGDDKFLYLSSIALGLSGGFRQDLIVFMFPLWLFSIYYQNFDYKKIFKAFMLLIASTLLWFIPTIMLTGGLWKYLQLDHSQLVVGAIRLNSIFFGATMINQLTMDNELLSWTILGIGFFSIIILLFFTFFNLKRVFILSNFKNSKIIFLILWIIPAFLFYLLFYIAIPGYTLVYLPVFAIMMGYVIVNLSWDINRKFKNISARNFSLLIIILCVLFGVTQFISPSISGVDYGNIQFEDSNSQYINQSLTEFNPGNTIAFLTYMFDWRKSTYYEPNYETYSYSNVNNTPGTTLQIINHYKDHEMNLIEGQNFEIHLNSSTDNILWLDYDNSEFYKQLQSKIEIKTIILPDGFVVYYSDLKNITNFTVDNITFIKD